MGGPDRSPRIHEGRTIYYHCPLYTGGVVGPSLDWKLATGIVGRKWTYTCLRRTCLKVRLFPTLRDINGVWKEKLGPIQPKWRRLAVEAVMHIQNKWRWQALVFPPSPVGCWYPCGGTHARTNTGVPGTMVVGRRRRSGWSLFLPGEGEEDRDSDTAMEKNFHLWLVKLILP